MDINISNYYSEYIFKTYSIISVQSGTIYKQAKGVRLMNNVISVTSQPRQIDCANMCSANVTANPCLSFNYHSSDNTCELNSDPGLNPADFISDSTWDWWTFTKMTLPLGRK